MSSPVTSPSSHSSPSYRITGLSAAPCRVEPVIERFLAAPAVAFLHLHFARRGCYAARVDRAGRDAH